jgi:hypothetical protein
VVLALAAVIFGFFFFKKKEVLSSFLKNKVKPSLTKDGIPFN